MDRSEARGAAPTENTSSYRLYPSLPNVDRYGVCGPSMEQRLQKAAALCGNEDTQLEAAAADEHVTMRARMLILGEQNQELLSINEKWAKEYRTMQQYYKQKFRDLKASPQQSNSPADEKLQEEEDLDVTFYKKLRFRTDEDRKPIEDLEAEVLRAEEEARELREQNNVLNLRGQHQLEEIRRLNKALEKALQASQPLSCSETLQDLWKHQAQVYKEDFQKERKDREKLKGKYLELRQRFIKVDNELRGFKSQLTWTPTQPQPSCSCTDRDRCYNWVKSQYRNQQ